MSAIERFNGMVDIYSNRPVTPKLKSAYLCFKITLLLANLMFMIFAIVLLGVGSYALNAKVNVLVGSTLPAGIIAMGVFMLLLSGLGAISAWKENVLGLTIYFIILSLISIILFSIALAVYIKKDSAPTYIVAAWNSANNDLRVDVQNALSCCGLTQYNDTAGFPCPVGTNVTLKSCYLPLVDAFNYAYKQAGGTGIAFAVIMGVGMFLVCCLIEGVKKKRHEQTLASMAPKSTLPGELSPEQIALDYNEKESAASMFDKHQPKQKRKPQAPAPNNQIP